MLKEYELSDREKDIMRGYWGDIENRRMPKQKYEPVNPQSWKKSTPNNQTPKHYQYDNQYSQMKESAGGIDLMFDRQSELDDKPEATPKGYIIVNDDGAGFTRSGIYGTPAWTGQLDARQFGGVTVYKSLAAAKRVAKKIGGTVREY